MNVQRLPAPAAKARVHSGQEVAFLDVREAAAFGEGHPLFAVPCPYSRLELSAVALVPRADAPILLIDGGDGIAARAADRLAACGYTDLSLVEGGLPAWQAAGFGVFAGVNVPSKTLGELAEHAHHPATIDAPTLARWQSEGRPFYFFDARPPAEYAKMRVPGARCLPNGELAHRFDAAVADSRVPVLVTCAGRTRGILGALGLRAAGVPNPVYALENGTQGWALEGFALDRGAEPEPFPSLGAPARAASRTRADELIAGQRLPRTGRADLSAALAESGRTTFLFDLRSAAERNADPCGAAVPVLAGQIVQATDQYVGVRHARIVLIDDTGLRAALTALWLRALGFEAEILALDAESHAGPLPGARHTGLRLPPLPAAVSPEQALALMAQPGAVLLDLRASQSWETARLAGARWAIRPELASAIAPGTTDAILFTDEAAVAAAAVLDLAEAGCKVWWLGVGLDACRRAGWSIDDAARPLSQAQAVDRVWFVHDRHDGNREASLRYLAWETGLVGQLDAAERAEFRDVALPAAS